MDNTIRIILAVRNMMGPGLRAASRALNQFSVGAQRAGMAMGAGAAIMGAGMFKVLRLVSTLDDKLREVEARIPNITKGGMAKLTAQAKLLGRTTSFTTTQVAELMSTLAQGGKGVDEIEKLTPKMLNLARATNITTEAAAKFTQQAIAGFGLKASDAGRVADVLTVAANSSFQGVEDLGEALTKAALSAKNSGQGFESTIATLAVLANMGVRGAAAGTQLRRVLLQMTDKGGEVADTLGVKWKTAAGNMKELPDLLEDFKKKTDNMGNVQKLALFNEAFGKIGLNAGIAIGESADGFNEMIENLTDASGAAKRTAALMDKGFGGTLRRLWSAVEGSAIAIGESMVPAVTILADAVVKLLTWLTPLLEKMENMGTRAVILFLSLAGGAVTLLTAAGVATVLAAIFGSLAAIVMAVVAVLGMLWTGFFGLIALVGSIPALLGTVALGLILFFTDWNKMVSGVSKSFEGMLDGMFFEYEGFINAIKKGEFKLAFDIAFLSMRISFTQTLDHMSKDWRVAFQEMTSNTMSTFLAILKLRSGIKAIGSDFILLRQLMKKGMTKEEATAEVKKQSDARKAAFKQFEIDMMNSTNAVNSAFTKSIQDLKDELEKLKKEAEPDKDYINAWKSAFDEIMALAKKAANQIQKDLQASWDMVNFLPELADWMSKSTNMRNREITTSITQGAIVGTSAASLQSNLAKSTKDIMQDQLTEAIKTNQLLINIPQLGFWGI
jgi:TP901 family phage tail tape measure protein